MNCTGCWRTLVLDEPVPRWQPVVWAADVLVTAPVLALAFWGAVPGPAAAGAPLHSGALAAAPGARLHLVLWTHHWHGRPGERG